MIEWDPKKTKEALKEIAQTLLMCFVIVFVSVDCGLLVAVIAGLFIVISIFCNGWKKIFRR